MKQSIANAIELQERENNFDTSEIPNLGKLAMSQDSYYDELSFSYKLKNILNARPKSRTRSLSAAHSYSNEFFDHDQSSLEMLKIANNYDQLVLTLLDKQRGEMKNAFTARNKSNYIEYLRSQSNGLEREIKPANQRFSTKGVSYARLENCGSSVKLPTFISKSKMKMEERLSEAFASKCPKNKGFIEMSHEVLKSSK